MQFSGLRADPVAANDEFGFEFLSVGQFYKGVVFMFLEGVELSAFKNFHFLGVFGYLRKTGDNVVVFNRSSDATFICFSLLGEELREYLFLDLGKD